MDERTYVIGAIALAALVAVLVSRHRDQIGQHYVSVLARVVLLIATVLLFIDLLSILIRQ
jgi:uncharacterized membrane protein YiaA